MLSLKKIHASSAGAAAKYFAGYYAEGGAEAVGDSEGAATGEPPGRWHGAGAEKLGLAGNISKADLEAILSGTHPKTGEQLIAPQKDRVTNGRDLKAIAARDLTFSAPKSVSAVWAAGNDAQRAGVTEAHNRAVTAALDYLRENGMRYPTGHAGGGGFLKGDAVVALFEHSTSRANDPQLHTHALVFFGVREDGQIKRIDFDMSQIHAAGAVYRSALAAELQRQGFEIERADPKEGFFRIAGVPSELERDWSKRRAQVEAALREAGRTDAVTSSKAAAATRADKENPNRQMNFGRWTEEAKAHGFGPEAIENLRGRVGSAAGMEPGKTDEELIAEAMDKSVVMSEAKLARVVYADSVGRYGPEAAEARLAGLRASLVTLERKKNGRTETRLTTQAVLDREARIAVSAQALAGSRAHAIRPEAVERAIAAVNVGLAKKVPGGALAPEQVAMIRGATDGKGLILVQGHAGTGKTFTLKPVVDLYQDRGYRVVGTSTTANAAKLLGREAGIESSTIAMLKIRLDRGEFALDDRTVVIVDEAGMVSSSDMDFVLGEARAAGAKVILVGDSKQIDPVDAGRPFEDLQDSHPVLELKAIQRQKDERDREVSSYLRNGDAERVVPLLKERGQWHVESSIRAAREAIAHAYADRRAAGHDVLIVAAENSDVKALNNAARSALREFEAIKGLDVEIETVNGNLALAVGDRVLFRHNDLHGGTETTNGTLGEVKWIDRKKLVVSLEDGKRIELRLDHEERIEKALKAKETIDRERSRLQKEGKAEFEERNAKRLENSVNRLGNALDNALNKPSKKEVKEQIAARKEAFKRDRARIANRKHEIRDLSEKSSQLSSEIKSLKAQAVVISKIEHGHAITAHKSQGKSVDESEAIADRPELRRGGDALVFAEGNSLENTSLLYVAGTRNKGQVHFYMRAADESAVIDAIGKPKEKDSVKNHTLKADVAEQQKSKGVEQRESVKADVALGREAPPVTPGDSRPPTARRERESGAREDWRAEEERRWAARQASLDERAREGRERWEREQREHRERQSRLGSGRVLDPVEVALARARGSAEAAAANREAQDKMAVSAWVNSLGGRQKGGDGLRLAGITVDRESFVEASVDEARIEKEHAEARKSVQYMLSREQSDREDGRNMDAIMMEVHRLKTSPDARERFRGEMLEEMQVEIDRRHASGDVGGARYSRSLLVETMRQDRDRFEREREYADARNVIEAKETIERMRASPDPAVREAGEQARKQLGQSNLKQLAGDVTGARVDREKLVASLREQTPERAQKAGREVSEALPEGSPSPEVSKAATAKPAQPAQGRSDGPEMDHA